MEETFFININCSKILENCDESQYTMFIDSTKMSIVYELTEWIRWIFSLDHCFYLMHENSVIHELEDVQFLSKLKNFEIRPCGQPNCVHKKMYRNLLDSLNLFVSWNNVKVHKYFLDKLTKMDKNFSQESGSGNSLSKTTENANDIQNYIKNTAKTEYNKFFFCDNVQTESGLEGTPLTKKQVLIDNFVFKPGSGSGSPSEVSSSGTKKKEEEIVNKEETIFSYYKDNMNPLNHFHNAEGRQLTTDAERKTRVSQNSPVKNELKVTQATTKISSKPGFNKSSQKHPRPFSLGELLSNIRGDFEKQNVEETSKSNNTFNSCALECGHNDEIGPETHLFLSEDNTGGGRKRPRTRKRKRSKKQSQETEEYISPFLDAIVNVSHVKCSLNIPKSVNKPNHIRFDVEDDLIENKGWNDDFSTENNKELIKNEGTKDNSMMVTQRDTNKFVAANNDINQDLGDHNGFSCNNTDNKMEISSEHVTPPGNEAKLIDLDEPPCESPSHTHNTPESSKSYNQDLKVLLNLKEKFKSAVVIERFY